MIINFNIDNYHCSKKKFILDKIFKTFTLFFSKDIAPQQMENEIKKMVQKFFIQLIPPTFLCMTTGPCKSVSQSYANCLQNNSPFWKAFFGMEPIKISDNLWQAIIKYRFIQSTINKLHRLTLHPYSYCCFYRSFFSFLWRRKAY